MLLAEDYWKSRTKLKCLVAWSDFAKGIPVKKVTHKHAKYFIMLAGHCLIPKTTLHMFRKRIDRLYALLRDVSER